VQSVIQAGQVQKVLLDLPTWVSLFEMKHFRINAFYIGNIERLFNVYAC